MSPSSAVGFAVEGSHPTSVLAGLGRPEVVIIGEEPELQVDAMPLRCTLTACLLLHLDTMGPTSRREHSCRHRNLLAYMATLNNDKSIS